MYTCLLVVAIHATTYVNKGKKNLVSLGSWSAKNATAPPSFEWMTLGLSSLKAPAMTGSTPPNRGKQVQQSPWNQYKLGKSC